jgi:RNA polymerase sigma factor (sigma-70 family)
MSKDLELANRICQELRHNNNHAAQELVELYGRYLEAFTRKQLGEIDLPEMDSDEWIKDLLQGFWKKKILEEKVVCAYEGRNGASLKSFLFSVMRNYISQQFKVIIRRKEKSTGDMTINWEPSSSSEEYEKNIIKIIDLEDLSDDWVQEKLNRAMVDMALKELSLKRPEDEKIISFRMKDDLTYRQIAQQELEAQGLNPDNDEVTKKAAAFRQQCTRPKTGAMARFAVIYMKILAENGYELEMIDNMPILKRAEPKCLC